MTSEAARLGRNNGASVKGAAAGEVSLLTECAPGGEPHRDRGDDDAGQSTEPTRHSMRREAVAGTPDSARVDPSPIPRASVAVNAGITAAEIAGRLYAQLTAGRAPSSLSLVIVFFAPNAPRQALTQALTDRFGDIPVVGCTSAGEITPDGYAEDTVTALALAQPAFKTATALVPSLSEFRLEEGAPIARDLLRAGQTAFGADPNRGDCFAILLVDGASRQEEALVAALAHGLGGVPIFGGSAACGLDFDETYILEGGQLHTDAALLILVHSRYPFDVFCLDHFEPSDQKMVVTAADPDRRIVTEINAEPAAIEYARLVGIAETQLSPFVFAEHPVVVRVGGQYHVRAIQRVEPDGSLQFFCAIDEGLVLTVARSLDMSTHLAEAMAALAGGREPLATLGFDCILRRLEAEHKQAGRAISETLSRYNSVGFCTYGEQYRSMHVNQTFTGVMIHNALPSLAQQHGQVPADQVPADQVPADTGGDG
ncbi:MAG: FIST N-terminal domain-containing protein [Pseudomonadota bacterium]